MVTNSVKYAFSERSGRIDMRLTEEEGSYHLCYRDSGPGVVGTDAFFNGETLGVSLIRLTVEQMHGNVSVQGSNGLEYRIRFES